MQTTPEYLRDRDKAFSAATNYLRIRHGVSFTKVPKLILMARSLVPYLISDYANGVVFPSPSSITKPSAGRYLVEWHNQGLFEKALLLPASTERIPLAKAHKGPHLAAGLKPKIMPLPKRAGKRDGFYLTRAWRELRYKALKLYGRMCMVCGASALSGAVIHVDHIKPRSTHPHLRLDINNLQVLCEDCNIGKCNYDEIDWRPDAGEALKRVTDDGIPIFED